MTIIQRLWKQSPGNYFSLAFKGPDGQFRQRFFERERISDAAAFATEHKEHDLWFCPHGFSEKLRQKGAAVAPPMLWADLDEAHPDKIKFRPTIAIESSPERYVGLWMLDQPMTED